eukprot:113710-Prymnesium_polylepis.2
MRAYPPRPVALAAGATARQAPPARMVQPARAQNAAARRGAFVEPSPCSATAAARRLAASTRQ